MKLSSYILGFVLVLILYILGPFIFIVINNVLDLPIIDNNLLKLIGLLLIIFGISFNFYLLLLFKFEGKGSPVPTEGAKKLIIKGPYKYVRNPMYLGHIFVWLGEFFLFGSILLLVYIALLFFKLHMFVVFWEEPNLKKKFEKDYEEYLLNVPRWIPKMFE